MSTTKKPKEEPIKTGPQKPAFDPGKTYRTKPHPQHPKENDPPEYEEFDDEPDEENQRKSK